MKHINHADPSGTVCLDAMEVKRIRESQQLTQLYVSKVVGVTTDTISRWENNRYPTIRRENALKLAVALEVSLEDLLQKPVEELVTTGQEKKKTPSRLWWGLLAVLLISVAAYYLVFSNRPQVLPTVTAQRLLPAFSGPGSSVPVQIVLTSRSGSDGVILREYFPKGWKIVQSHPPASSLDNVNGIARWILKVGEERDRVVYLIQVDPEAKLGDTGNFQGEIVSSREGSQSAVPVQGEVKTSVAPLHWADVNGDNRIDDGEMLQGSYTIEDMNGVYIDWEDLERLWDGGSYGWSKEKKRFVPQPR